MNRRKDGRELFEVFKEQVAAASAAVKKEAPVFRAEPKVTAGEDAVHSVKLGDRRQVEIFLSMGWVYGAIFFVVLLVACAFAVGRHFAPPPEVADLEPVQAPPAAVSTLQQVGDVQQLAPPSAQAPPPARQQAQAGSPGAAGKGAQASSPAGGVKVTSGGMYTLCVITYLNKGSARANADAVAKFLTDKGLPDVRVLTDAGKARLIVAVGRFATKNGADVSTMKARLAAITYKTTRFDKSYVATLKGYQ